MKNNLDFYRHKVNSHNHWKFRTLRLLYEKTFHKDGWAGEGKFWALNNIIAASEDCMYDHSNEIQNIDTATLLGFTTEEYMSFLNLLHVKCKLIHFKEQFMYTEYTQEILSEVQDIRRSGRERQAKCRAKLEAEQAASRVTRTKSHVKKTASQNDIVFKRETDFENGKKSDESGELAKGQKGDFAKQNGMSRVTGSDFGEQVGNNIVTDIHSTVQYIKESNTPNGVLPETKVSVEVGKGENLEGEKKPEEEKQPQGPGAEKKRVRKKPEDTTPHFAKLREVFDGLYRMVKGINYIWKPVDHAHLKVIGDALQKIAEGEGREWTISEAAKASNQLFSTAATMSWLKANLSLPNISAKINEILVYKKEPDSHLPAQVPSVLYDTCLQDYVDWFKDTSDGMMPLIRHKDEQAFGHLLAYMQQVTLSLDNQPPDIAGALKLVYSKWSCLDAFLAGKKSLRDIYNNINEIIEQIKKCKNGTNTKRANGAQRGFTNSFASREEELAYIDSALGSRAKP